MLTLQHRSAVGLLVAAVLFGCHPEKPAAKSGQSFESRYLHDMRAGKKPPRTVAIELDERPSLTETQSEALVRLARNELQIFPEVRRRVYEDYAEAREILNTHLRTDDPTLALIMPAIRTGTEIDRLVTLVAIEVSQDGRRILLMYETAWDVEHGFNIVLLDGAVERAGLAVDVFLPKE